MKCVNHPEVDAVGACVGCGEGLCADCKRELGIKFYCQSCAHEMLTQKTAPAATVTSGNARNTIGRTLIMIGIVGAIWAFIFSVDRANASQHDEMELIGLVLIGIPGILISFFMIAIGLVLINTGKSAKALVCGIFSLLLPVFGILLGLLAITFGAASLAQLKKNPSLGGRKTAIAGMVMGIIGIVVWIVWYVIWCCH